MSILNRLKNIFTSNWDTLTENFENPQSDSQAVLRQMQEAVNELRSTAAAALTECKLVERRYKELQNEKISWMQKAEDAAQLGRDDLARQALEQKNKLEDEIDKSINQLNQADQDAEELKEQLHKAEVKLAKLQKDYQLFEHQQNMLRAGVKSVDSQVDNIEQLEEEFRQLNDKPQQSSIDDELAALKNQLQSKNKTEK